MQRALAFLRRDLRLQLSYRFAFVLQISGIFFNMLVFFFFSKLVGPSAMPYLSNYGGDYFAFVLVGLAFSGYFGVGLQGFASTIREAQTTGTLEAMLLTPTRLRTVVLASSLYDYGFVTLQVILYLLFGALLFGVQINGNLPAALVILLLTIVAMTAVGIIAASFIMVLKRGDPVTWLFNSVGLFLGGVYYPVSLMPSWLQALSWLLPITYSLDGMRRALLTNASWAELWKNILALAIFSVVLTPISLAVFRRAVHRAKVDGSLAHF